MVWCNVPQCSQNYTGMTTYYRWPNEKIMQTNWSIALKLDVLGKTEISENFRICNFHFTDDDYYLTEDNVKRLKSEAIPTQNLPQYPLPVGLATVSRFRDSLKKRTENYIGRLKIQAEKNGNNSSDDKKNDEDIASLTPNKLICCVRDCVSSSGDNFPLFKFPEKQIMLFRWSSILKMKNISKYDRICGRHFSATNFHGENTDFQSEQQLTDVAVPDRLIDEGGETILKNVLASKRGDWKNHFLLRTVLMKKVKTRPKVEAIKQKQAIKSTTTKTKNIPKLNSCKNLVNSTKSRNFIKEFCSVPGCCSIIDDEMTTLHPFPNFLDPLRRIWISRCGIKKPVTEDSFICSNHFTPADFKDGGIFILKFNSVPSRFPERSIEPIASKAPPTPSRHKRKTTTEINSFAADVNPGVSIEIPPPKQMKCNDETVVAETIPPNYPPQKDIDIHFDEIKIEVPEDETDAVVADPLNFFQKKSNYFTEIAIQTDPVPIDLQHERDLSESLVSTTNHLEIMTGLTNHDHLDHIERGLKAMDKYQNVNISNEDLPCPRKRTVLVLIKLRTNIDFGVLGVLFGLNETKSKWIFTETIHDLRSVLQSEVCWSNGDFISANLEPNCSLGTDVRGIMKIFHITLKRRPYSASKSGKESFKFLIVVSPIDGRINYIGPGYRNQESDRFIVLNERILDKIKDGEVIKVTDAYGFKNEFENKKIRELTGFFDSDESKLIYETLRFMEEYKVITDEYDGRLISSLNSIVCVVASLVNLCRFQISLNKI